MKKVLTIASALVLSTGAAFSQGLTDAYRYAQTGDLSGTARSMSMGGAFGALGGDISVINTNPAGLAVYRSSEVVATLDVSGVSAKTDWQGTSESKSKTKFNFDNFAYVGYFPTGKDAGVVSWNVGISYNRLKNYSRSYRMSMTGSTGSSMADYIAARANLGGLTPDLAFRYRWKHRFYELPERAIPIGFSGIFLPTFPYGDAGEREWGDRSVCSCFRDEYLGVPAFRSYGRNYGFKL